jgi:hypothetical protein
MWLFEGMINELVPGFTHRGPLQIDCSLRVNLSEGSS